MINEEPLTPPNAPLSVTLMPASECARSTLSVMPAASMAAPVIAVMLSGMFCADSERRVAVTMTSCNVSESAGAGAPYKALSTPSVTADI